MDKKTKKLKNLYTGEVVLTDNINPEVIDKYNDIEFIRVYKESNPQRKYLVNRLAYEVVNK